MAPSAASGSGKAATRLKWAVLRAMSTGDAANSAPASHDSSHRPVTWRASRNVQKPLSVTKASISTL